MVFLFLHGTVLKKSIHGAEPGSPSLKPFHRALSTKPCVQYTRTPLSCEFRLTEFNFQFSLIITTFSIIFTGRNHYEFFNKRSAHFVPIFSC